MSACLECGAHGKHWSTCSKIQTPEIGIDFLGMAIRTAVANVSNDGGPFGAVVVMPDGFWAVGSNRVTAGTDPTAHAEVSAIRNAAVLLGTHDLRGSTLYSSCAPCPMCLAAALWANVDGVVYASSPEDAAASGFDDWLLYRELATVAVARQPLFTGAASFAFLSTIRVIRENRPDSLEPFTAWAAKTDRIDY